MASFLSVTVSDGAIAGTTACEPRTCLRNWQMMELVQTHDYLLEIPLVLFQKQFLL